MQDDVSLDRFITSLANKIARVCPGGCSCRDDYIQAGHLKLAEIRSQRQACDNFDAYAMRAVARAMREEAVNSMFTISAPHRVKRQAYKIMAMLSRGMTESEACLELDITDETMSAIMALVNTRMIHAFFSEPETGHSPFSEIGDLLSHRQLTQEDRTFLQSQIDGSDHDLTRKQRWTKMRQMRRKLNRSGYGR